jgi:hypothetical protein
MEKRTRIIDNIVFYGYEHGFWQSLIIHCVVLLTLSFVFIVAEKQKPPIVIELSSLSEVVEYDNTNTVNLELEVTTSHFVTDTNNTELITEPESSINPVFEEESIPESSDTSDIVSMEESTLLESMVNHKPNIDRMFDDVESPVKVKSENSTSQTSADNTLKQLVSKGTSIGKGIPKRTITPSVSTGAPNATNSIEEKIQMYGAGTGDVQISLSWSTPDDIDLHVQYIGSGINEIIFWRKRAGVSGAILDIDMNAGGPRNNNPIENVFWPYNSSPHGRFVVGVHFFRSWTSNTRVPVTVRIKTLKGVYTRNSVVVLGQDIQVIETFTN